MKLRTQKAKGILRGIPNFYDHIYYSDAINLFETPEHGIVYSDESLEWINEFPNFARPCPKRPRHGFVDSRVIRNRKQLKELWDEVKNADPNGELLIGDYFKKVKSNSVYVCDGMLSIGPGNNGATGGKNSISFPVSPLKKISSIKSSSGISSKESMYVETIYADDIQNIVQLRGGPSISPVSPDYIPKNMKVKHVVAPHDDLLEWESDVKKFKAGTVVYGNGHTLASHAAIHCILNKVPFITTKKPKVGTFIKKTNSTDIKIDRQMFRKGVKSAINICKYSDCLVDIRMLLIYSLSVLHNWAYMKNSKHASWLLGSASTFLAKICVMVVMGENRYSPESKDYHCRGMRNNVYTKSMKCGIQSFKELPQAFRSFHSGKWDEGFGSIKWANCAWYTHSLWNSITMTYNKKSKYLSNRDILGIVDAMNKIVNLEHNNGWWLDKFSKTDDMDMVALFPGTTALGVSHMYLDVYNRVSDTKNLSRNMMCTKLKDPAFIGPYGSRYWVIISKISGGEEIDIKVESDDGTYEDEDVLYVSSKEYHHTKYHYPYAYNTYNPVAVYSPNGIFDLGTSQKYNVRKIFGIKP